MQIDARVVSLIHASIRKIFPLTYITFIFSRMHVKFENLFNGNKELGASLNELINDNWKTLWSDMEPQVNDAVMKIVKHLLESVLQVLPYEDFYRKD